MSNEVKGVVGGSAINGLILPINPLIREYSMNKGSLFKLFCSARYVESPSFKKGEGGKVHLVPNPPKIDPIVFEAICNDESFTLNHAHQYGNVGGITGRAVDALSGETGSGLLALAKGIADYQVKSEVNFTNDWNQ